jgi:hypothetical protein
MKFFNSAHKVTQKVTFAIAQKAIYYYIGLVGLLALYSSEDYHFSVWQTITNSISEYCEYIVRFVQILS